MKKIFYFIIAGTAALVMHFWSFTAIAEYYGTFYGVSSYSTTSKIIRSLTTIGMIIGIILLVPALIVILIKKFRKVRFNYNSDYKKFKPNDKVKITFADENGKIITKHCHINSITNKKIVFENKTAVYECVPSDIKNMRKRNKKIFIVVLTAIFFLLLGFIIRNTNYAVEMYGVPEIKDWGN